MTRSLGTAAGLGAVSGLRSLQGLAWCSRALVRRRPTRGAGHLERLLSHDLVADTLGLAAAVIAVLFSGALYLFLNLNLIAKTGITLRNALLSGMLIFLPSECVKGIFAFIFIKRIKPLILLGL